jgi:cation diffusion facilitator CzcD-associated flavoprotein CzcO
MNGYANGSTVEKFDVIIVGAGISGINAAYRVQTQLPKGTTYTIFDTRGAIGGTWDLFKYPGIRSDSDLYTFGFPWRPWRAGHAIAEAPLILDYLKDSARDAGIDKNIRFHHKVISADWSSDELLWNLTVEVGEKTVHYKGGFMILGTGYYDYDEPLQTTIPGIENFKGPVIHPQFWPETLDYAGKEVAIIGSGATAITILPNMAKTAKMVTIVQRSPSYVFSLPNRDDPLIRLMQYVLPQQLAHTITRWRWMITSYFFFYFCRTFPNAAKKIIGIAATKQLPKDFPLDPHFKPSYNPWEQRMCLAPDGDFYRSIKKGKANMVTGAIKTVNEDGIKMEDGSEVKANIIVTATGLKLKLAGGIKPSIDGKPLDISTKFMWKGVMLQDLPNACVVIGYTNASWTLGADATAQMVTRLINLMKKRGAAAAVPRLAHPEEMESTPMLNLSSTYIQKALSIMPKTGTGQWAPRSQYFSDIRQAKYGDIESGLEFISKKDALIKSNESAQQQASL